MSTRFIGTRGEDFAVAYLVRRGYVILERNWRYAHKEVDIIAKEGEYLVFLEVKTRKKEEYLDPLLVFSRKQQKNIIECAYQYVDLFNQGECPVRFDLLCIVSATGAVEHWEDVIRVS